MDDWPVRSARFSSPPLLVRHRAAVKCSKILTGCMPSLAISCSTLKGGRDSAGSVLGGAGVYHRIVQIAWADEPAVGYTTFCDPYLYVCYRTPVAVNNIIGDHSSTDFGINVGGGFTYGLPDFRDGTSRYGITTCGDHRSQQMRRRQPAGRSRSTFRLRSASDSDMAVMSASEHRASWNDH